MLKKGILLSAIVLALVFSFTGIAEARRGIVIPTAWGYGVVNSQAPYTWPAYGYQGMHPAMPVPTFQWSAPVWNGATWVYYNSAGYNGYYPVNTIAAVSCNLNIRSEPYVAGKKKRNSNVIGLLKTGEQVYVMGRYGNWFLVQSAWMPLRQGYVYGSYLRFYQNNWPSSHYTAFYPAQLSGRAW